MLVRYAKKSDFLSAVSGLEEKSKQSVHAPWLTAQLCANVHQWEHLIVRCTKRCHIVRTVIHRSHNDMCAVCWYDDYGHWVYIRHHIMYEDVPQIGSVLVIKYVDEDGYNRSGTIITAMLKASRMNLTQLAAYFGIPYKTMQNWDSGCNAPADYLIELMVYKLQHEGLWDNRVEPVIR